MSLAVALLLSGDALVLRERVAIEGRYIRLIDVVQADPAAEGRYREVYLGKAPPAGECRVLSAAEIRRELEWRGFDAAVLGEKVEVTGPGGGVVRAPAAVRRGEVVRAVSAAYEADARAVEAGFPGAVIAIEFLATKGRARARVREAGRVEVLP